VGITAIQVSIMPYGEGSACICTVKASSMRRLNR
jgi:hypothetical protein